MNRCNVDLTIVRNADPEIFALYEASLVLIRPDQIVAWRGHDGAHAPLIVDKVLGRHLEGQSAVNLRQATATL
jgi:hypothetical protein